MFAWLLLLLFARSASRNLKALWNFEAVTECVLHYRALVYNDYGCWCGVGGAFEPVDGIDECCMEHDHCYDNAIYSGTCYDVPVEYLDPYKWQCKNSTAMCLDDPVKEPCSAALCKCDTTVVGCWSQFQKPTTKVKCNHSMIRTWRKKHFDV